MADTGEHCPFVNRADSRCAVHLRLDGLRHSYHFCFGNYQGCRVYNELLAERRRRRGESPADPSNAPLTYRFQAPPPPPVALTINSSALKPVAPPTGAGRVFATGRGIWTNVRRGITAGMRLAGAADRNEPPRQNADPSPDPAGPHPIGPGRQEDAAADPRRIAAAAHPPGLRKRAG